MPRQRFVTKIPSRYLRHRSAKPNPSSALEGLKEELRLGHEVDENLRAKLCLICQIDENLRKTKESRRAAEIKIRKSKEYLQLSKQCLEEMKKSEHMFEGYLRAVRGIHHNQVKYDLRHLLRRPLLLYCLLWLGLFWFEDHEWIDNFTSKFKAPVTVPGKVVTHSAYIRLLQIESASHPDSDINCVTKTVPLQSGQHYHALSYVWGTSLDTCPISMDGKVVNVRTNLFHALKQLRHTDGPRLLWVDALCINQQDEEEKSGQIKLMGDIYANAEAVFVWLGDEKPGTQKAFDQLKGIAQFRAKTTPIYLVDRIFGRGNLVARTLGAMDLKPIIELLENPWVGGLVVQR